MEHVHEEKHFTESALIRDVILGVSDGLTVPFALAAGLTNVVTTNGIIITAGVAEIVAGSIAMGLGGYLAGRTQIEHYHGERKREHHEVKMIPEQERDEIREILAVYGVSRDTQNRLIGELESDPDRWVDFMMKFELGLEQPNLKQASRSAFNIGFSYLLGGAIPLSPYFFTPTPSEGLFWSSVVTLSALFCFGFLKSKLVGQKPFWGAIRFTGIGALAASAAFLIARSFQW